MGYIKYNGLKYGICPYKRSFWTSLILNLPVINLLYSKKIKMNLTSRQRDGAPVTGVFSYFRIFKNQDFIKFRFMVPKVFERVMVTIDDMNDHQIGKHRNLPDENKYFPGKEYHEIFRVIAD